MSFYRILLCSMPLLLTACGDGWEAQRTTEVFPYGNKRTAGSGVVYVRAKMLPEKELIVEPVVQEVPAAEPAPAPVLSGDKIFNEAQTKGGAHPPPHAKVMPVPAHAAVEKAPEAVSEAVAPAAATEVVAPAVEKAADAVKEEIKEEIKEETHGSAADVVSPAKQDKVKSKMVSASFKLNSDESLSQAHPQEREVSVSALRSEDVVAPVAAAPSAVPAARVAAADVVAYEVYPNEVIEPTRSVSMPRNEIVSPKKDYIHVNGEGRKTLDQIYENPF